MLCLVPQAQWVLQFTVDAPQLPYRRECCCWPLLVVVWVLHVLCSVGNCDCIFMVHTNQNVAGTHRPLSHRSRERADGLKCFACWAVPRVVWGALPSGRVSKSFHRFAIYRTPHLNIICSVTSHPFSFMSAVVTHAAEESIAPPF